NDQVVVTVAAPGGLDAPGARVDTRRGGVDEIDAVRLEGRAEREGDVLRRSLAEGQPDERRVEQEGIRRRYHRDVGILVELVFYAEGRGQPAEVAAEHQNLLTHGTHLSSVDTPRVGTRGSGERGANVLSPRDQRHLTSAPPGGPINPATGHRSFRASA